ncbi:MAG: response regulator [Acidobacteriota bacterium]
MRMPLFKSLTHSRILPSPKKSEAKEMVILIVEDNEQMRRLMKSMLSDLAERIHECSDGEQSLAAYERWRPDWVLMDIRMQSIDGIAATRQIKAAHPEARIVIVTDYSDERFRRAAHSAGASDYVLKENLLALRRILALRNE